MDKLNEEFDTLYQKEQNQDDLKEITVKLSLNNLGTHCDISTSLIVQALRLCQQEK